EELLRVPDRERRYGIDRLPADAYVARFAAQPRAAAIGARQVPAVPAEEHANVHLVLLPLQPAEEAANPVVLPLSVSFDDEPALVAGELAPRHVEPDAALARGALQFRQLRPVVRLAPRLDGALVDRLR